MSDNVIQTSFAAGELSPNLNARVDFAKYRSGCATMRNFFVDYRSGASSRPGTEFIRPARYPTDVVNGKIRLVRFQQSVAVTYVLEFGQGYIRFVTQGSSVVEPALPVSVVTHGAATRLTVVGHTYVAGDTVFISGVGGIPQINNRYFNIINVVGTSFEITDSMTNFAVNSTGWPALTSPGISQRVYTIASPYLANELALLKFSQNASVMNITHPAHPPHKLQLFTATNWSLTPAVFGATVGPPGIPAISSSTSGPVFYKYGVTSVDANDQESMASLGVVSAADLRTVAGSNFITYTGVPGAVSFNIYGSSPLYTNPGATSIDGLGFMGSGTSGFFVDSNISADFSQTPPIHENPFTFVNPQVSSYFQQRLVYANGGGNLVATFWASKTGAYYNFDVSNPTQANDAITAELVSLEVNEIKSLVPMPTGLIALTTKGVWQINGGAGGVATQGGPITPVTATATPQAYIGADDVPPIVINYDIFFVQQKGSIVRDLTFNIYANIYTGNDVSILSSHMFYGHQVKEWAYAEEPFKMIWVVREDGIALSLTVVKEQDMYGWARHDTFGNFRSVCTVTEGTADATYFCVERPSPGPSGTAYVIERLADRQFPFGTEDAWCVDCGVSTIHNIPNAILTVSAAVGNVTLKTFPGVFTADMVDWVVRVGGGIIKLTQFVSATQFLGTVVKSITELIPNDPQKRPDAAPGGAWALDRPFTTVFGLDHLEGQPVAVLADGGVVNGLVVQDGSITLPESVTNVTVGYPFQAQLQTMPLDLGNEINSVQGKRKKIGALTVRVKDSRGVKAGMTFETVTPIKELNRTTVMGLPIPLITADERIVMDPLWDVPGQICIQVDDPLPTTILGVIPEVIVGDSGGK